MLLEFMVHSNRAVTATAEVSQVSWTAVTDVVDWNEIRIGRDYYICEQADLSEAYSFKDCWADLGVLGRLVIARLLAVHCSF
jgi:hypothetical protein